MSPLTPSRRAESLDAAAARVCVVIPVRNESAHIAETIACVLQQTFPAERTEVIVADGESDDGTRAILDKLAECNYRLSIIDNPARTIPTGLNIAIAGTQAEVIVRVDGRCWIAQDYIERCVELLAASRAGNVGGPVHAQGEGLVGRAIALAMRSRFGIGNSRYHYLDREELVDTVYMGAFRREVLEAVGGYDEEFVRNQDDELNYRIRHAGYGILLSPSILSSYTPPNSLRRLWKSQFYQYGLWKVRVIQKHPGSLQGRHLPPLILVLGLLGSAISFALLRRRWLLAPVFLYSAGLAAAAAWTARRSPRLFPVLFAVFGCMHLGYGTGFLVGLLRLASRRLASGSNKAPAR